MEDNVSICAVKGVEKYSWRLDKEVSRSDTQAQVESPCGVENKASSLDVQVQDKSPRCWNT